MTIETAALGAVGALVMLAFAWLWARIDNVQTESHSDRDAIQDDLDGIKRDVNKLKVELPTNYATKDDLTILKSDILTEIRELRTLYKENGDDIKAFITSVIGAKKE